MFSSPNSKLRVLVDGVVPGVERQRADRVALASVTSVVAMTRGE